MILECLILFLEGTYSFQKTHSLTCNPFPFPLGSCRTFLSLSLLDFAFSQPFSLWIWIANPSLKLIRVSPYKYMHSAAPKETPPIHHTQQPNFRDKHFCAATLQGRRGQVGVVPAIQDFWIVGAFLGVFNLLFSMFKFNYICLIANMWN